jgi:hypothetical protein
MERGDELHEDLLALEEQEDTKGAKRRKRRRVNPNKSQRSERTVRASRLARRSASAFPAANFRKIRRPFPCAPRAHNGWFRVCAAVAEVRELVAVLRLLGRGVLPALQRGLSRPPAAAEVQLGERTRRLALQFRRTPGGNRGGYCRVSI